jgi:hypothetical protein
MSSERIDQSAAHGRLWPGKPAVEEGITYDMLRDSGAEGRDQEPVPVLE